MNGKGENNILVFKTLFWRNEGARIMKKIFSLEVNSKRSQIIIYVFISYLLTWIYTVPKALQSQGIITNNVPVFLEYIGAFGPAIAAIAVVGLINGKDELQKLLNRIKIWRVDFKWYLIALFGQPFIWGIAILLYLMFGGETPNFSNTPIHDFVNIGGNHSLLMVIIGLFLQQFIALFGEEIGWRGYLLPKLLKSSHWVKSTLILGLIWALWHLPLFYIQGRVQANTPIFLYFFDLMISTVFFTWIFLKTKGSVLIATLFHTSINTSTVILPILPMATGNIKPLLLGVCLKLILALIVIKINYNIQFDTLGFNDIETNQGDNLTD
jgi:membrane protease YdiL (CAAX protease family)